MRLFAAGLLAAGLSLLLTPAAIRAALRQGFLDRPTGWKRHRRATPYLGGAAVTTAALAGAVAFGRDLDPLPAIAAGALLLLLVGTLDDRHRMRAAPRLLVESAAAIGLWAAGGGWDVGVPGFL